jgi:hypothetical protein
VKNGQKQVRPVAACCLLLAWCASAAVPGDAGESEDRSQSAGTIRSEFQSTVTHGGVEKLRGLKFAHLTTSDGLAQNRIYSILQDRRGFMWFATEDGLNRYDGNTFVVYENNPDDPNTLSAN